MGDGVKLLASAIVQNPATSDWLLYSVRCQSVETSPKILASSNTPKNSCDVPSPIFKFRFVPVFSSLIVEVVKL